MNIVEIKKLSKQEQKGIISCKIFGNDSLLVVFDWIDESIGANFKYKYNFIYNYNDNDIIKLLKEDKEFDKIGNILKV